MIALTSNIKITDADGLLYLDFDFVNEIEIAKSRKTLTDTAKVTIARKLSVFRNDTNGVPVDIKQIIKEGSKIEISLGYDGDLRTEFTGYIARVGAKVPLVIECEDQMWQLKQNSFTKAWKKVSLSEVISFIYDGPVKVANIELGGLVIKQQSTAQVLEALKKFGMQSYFENGILIVDFAGSFTGIRTEVFYDFQKNIIDNDLVYARKEDIKIKVRAVSKFHNGKKVELVVGDPTGEEHTLHYVNVDKKDLEKIVKAEIDKLKYNGYKNGFTSFGLPYSEPGNIAVLSDPEYPEHDGAYLIEAVNTTFGMNGFRRKVSLERKLA